MKNFAILIWICVVGCTTPAKVAAPNIPSERERLTQMEIRLVQIERRMQRIEEATTQILKKLNQQSTVEVKKVAELPLPIPEHGREKPLTPENREFGKEAIVELVNKTNKKPSDPTWVGQELPLSRFVRADGQISDLSEYRGKKNVALVIVRGFAGSVCIICSAQTVALAENIQKFQDRDTEVVLMYPGPAETIPGFLAALQDLQKDFVAPFPIVLDADLALVNMLSIQDQLAKPSSIIIDKTGVIRYAYFGTHSGDRPSVKVLLDEIDKIR